MVSSPRSGIVSKGNTIKRRVAGDIIECALRNDFKGVDRALAADPADINCQWEGSGITALMGAAGSNLGRMVRHLLSKEGVDTSVVDAFGNSALDHARLFPEVVAFLMRHKHPEVRWKEPGIFPV